MKNMTLQDTDVREEKMKGYGRFFILGLPNALLSFSQALTGIVLSDLIIYRTCLVSLNINDTECFKLRTDFGTPRTLHLEAEIEPHASMVLMTKSLIESILPTMLALFLGPWSDRGGRRPLLLAGLSGFILMFATLSVLSNFNISPWYLLIPSIPAYIMGGSTTVTLASNCYISDTTAQKDRTIFLAWLQSSIFTGVVLGLVTGPILYKTYGYAAVFTVAMFCCACALLHTYFFVPESVKDTTNDQLLHSLFKISFVKEILTSALTKQDGFHRPVVWLAIFTFTMCAMILYGDVNMGFLFTRARLGWDVQQFSYLSSIGVVLTIAGLCGVSILSPILGIPDTLLGGIGLISALSGELTKSFTWQGWHMYLAAAIAIFSGIPGPVMRSVVSKSIPAQDVGKVFSLMALLETLSPLGGAPLLTLVYSRYLPPVYPSPVFLLTSSLFMLLILCVVCIETLIRKSSRWPYIPAAQEECT